MVRAEGLLPDGQRPFPHPARLREVPALVGDRPQAVEGARHVGAVGRDLLADGEGPRRAAAGPRRTRPGSRAGCRGCAGCRRRVGPPGPSRRSRSASPCSKSGRALAYSPRCQRTVPTSMRLLATSRCASPSSLRRAASAFSWSGRAWSYRPRLSYTRPIVLMSLACTSGWSFRSRSIFAAPRSRISRAVTLLPRACPGSETLNSPTRKSETCRAASASWLARRASRRSRIGLHGRERGEEREARHDRRPPAPAFGGERAWRGSSPGAPRCPGPTAARPGRAT